MRQSLAALPDVALFVEVARAGSFRRAAARLELPPATLSRRIAAFETRLGVRLFLRTTRSVALTEIAKPYYERCLELIDAAERAQAAIVSGREQPGRIRISMPVDLGVEILGPLIASFAAERTGLHVDFELSSRAVDLLRDPVDLVFRIGRTMDDRVVARRIADIRSGVYGAPALLRRFAPIANPTQLVDMPCVNLQTAQGPMPWRVGNYRWDAAPGPCFVSANSVSLLRTLAEQGHGLVLLAEHMAVSGVRAKLLARVLPDLPTASWPLYAITAHRMVPNPVRQLIAHVKSALEHRSL